MAADSSFKYFVSFRCFLMVFQREGGGEKVSPFHLHFFEMNDQKEQLLPAGAIVRGNER